MTFKIKKQPNDGLIITLGSWLLILEPGGFLIDLPRNSLCVDFYRDGSLTIEGYGLWSYLDYNTCSSSGTTTIKLQILMWCFDAYLLSNWTTQSIDLWGGYLLKVSSGTKFIVSLVNYYKGQHKQLIKL